MTLSAAITRSPARQIVRRTRGSRDGHITRLMSPSDFGRLVKPFVFLDLFDNNGSPSKGFALHPHSGIATLTYLAEGNVSYEDTNGATGVLAAGGVEWMQAGGGVWHGGGAGESARTRGFQLWIALPPELELGPSVSLYQGPKAIQHHGPASVLLGSYGSATSAIDAPSPINYLAVRLQEGQRWRYQPPTGHTVLWVAVGAGAVTVPDELQHGDLATFEPSDVIISGILRVFWIGVNTQLVLPGPGPTAFARWKSSRMETEPVLLRFSPKPQSDEAVEFEAQSNAEFMVGSAVPHDHDLVLGYYSVHTSADALREGEARIAAIRARLVQEGRL